MFTRTVQSGSGGGDINIESLVPILTADSPSVISSTPYSSSWSAYKVFDGDVSTGFYGVASNSYIGYIFDSPKKVIGVTITNRIGSDESIKKFRVEGRNGDGNWIPLSDTFTHPASQETSKFYSFPNTSSYTQYRILTIEAYGTYIGLSQLEFLGY